MLHVFLPFPCDIISESILCPSAMSDDLTDAVLRIIDGSATTSRPVNSLDISLRLDQDHQRVVGIINSLLTQDELIVSEVVSTKVLELTAEGKQFVEHGSHEARVFAAIPAEGVDQAALMNMITDQTIDKKVGFSKALAAQWIKLDRSSKRVTRQADEITDTVSDLLSQIAGMSISDLPADQKAELKKRKLVTENTIKSFAVRKGAKFTTRLQKLETEITGEMMAKGNWKELQFKEYNFNARGVGVEAGHLHPLLKVRSEFRQIFLEMGFQEMRTNNWVESSFYNFDALFVPQQHPARDDHDTFFISNPDVTPVNNLPAEHLQRVRKVHSQGDYGSIGYQSEWKTSETQKNVLRTHTTACTARLLSQLAQDCQQTGDGEFTGGKYFSIDRVFRNETLDATHLAEFHQIEGVVAGVDVGLAHLMGVVKEFFSKMGLTEIKFKPAYNPYTEPSMEVFAYHPGLKKWVEIGNSGVFRPEMLQSIGLSDRISVLGFGLSCERPTMIKYGISNIRDLVGHKVDLQMVYDNPLCILSDA